MKIVKSIISVVLVFAILAVVLAFSGSAQNMIDKLPAINLGGFEEPPNVPDYSDDASVYLVWSENFENFVFEESKDVDGRSKYTNDNYFAFYADAVDKQPFSLLDNGNGNSLNVVISPSNNVTYKPRLNVAFDFTRQFNIKKLSFSKSKYIVMSFDVTFNNIDLVTNNDMYFRYGIFDENNMQASVITSSLKYCNGKFADKYELPENKEVRIVSIIDVSKNIEESDLYFYINDIDQVLVFEDFLKTNSSYVGYFEIFFDRFEKHEMISLDNFKLYTFGKGFNGSLSDALIEINFIK